MHYRVKLLVPYLRQEGGVREEAVSREQSIEDLDDGPHSPYKYDQVGEALPEHELFGDDRNYRAFLANQDLEKACCPPLVLRQARRTADGGRAEERRRVQHQRHRSPSHAMAPQACEDVLRHRTVDPTNL